MPEKANHSTISSGKHDKPIWHAARTRQDNENWYALKGKPGWLVQDMCDFCKEIGFVTKNALQQRKFGIRFGCSECKKNGLFDWDKDKVVLCTKTFPKNSFPGH